MSALAAVRTDLHAGTAVHVDGSIVVGAGPAGLAVASALNQVGVRAKVLDRAETVASSWRSYYDGLRLNSPRALSSLPGERIDRGCGRWPTRDDLIVYFERYARERCPEVDLGVTVESIDRTPTGWRLTTSEGTLTAPYLVMATGINQRPVVPDWPGLDGFTGDVLHGSEYRNAVPFAGRNVLVVGSGMTGTDITLELLAAGARRVQMSVRTPPLIFRPQTLGVPASFMGYLVKRLPTWSYPLLDPLTLIFDKAINGDLSAWGLQPPPEGLLSAMANRHHGITVDRGFVRAVKAAEITIVPAVVAFDGSEVLLADDSRVSPDVVISAIGQRPGLEPLLSDLGILTPDGLPIVHGASDATCAPGLHFIGYRLPPGQLPDMARDAKAVARRIRRAMDRA